MSSISKGRMYENKSKQLLESQGYKVEKPVWTKFTGKDFFGYFDLMAIKKGEKMLWIQVKTNYCPKKEKERIIDFCQNNLDKKIHQVELHIWKPYTGVKIERLL